MIYQKFFVFLPYIFALLRMDTSIKRVLYVDSEMVPYLAESEISMTTRTLAQKIQEKHVEIRPFVPRYGIINERKNQLHEVIRLSGMNIVIDNVDRPLIIKVASLPAARMQVYFIDNEDYFRRKALYKDSDGNYFKDNSERAAFFARGVLETVKKLRWSPDVIHCNGWISHILPLYLKKCYKDDPIFQGCKVVTSLYGDTPTQPFSSNFAEIVQYGNITEEDAAILKEPTGINLAKLAIAYSDGVIMASADVPEELIRASKDSGLPTMDYNKERIDSGAFVDDYKEFYEKL